MASKTYRLYFNLYRRKPYIRGLSAKSGVYCVYACTNNPSENTVYLRKLLYVGESENVQNRVASHEKWGEWNRLLQPGEELCFNAAEIAGNADRERAEAAMIYKHKPPCNTEYKNSFPYDETTVKTSGQTTLLHDFFTVYPTPATSGFGGPRY